MKKVKKKTTLGQRKTIITKIKMGKTEWIPEEILLIDEKTWEKYQYLL